MYRAVRWALFRLDPERAHELAVRRLERLHASSAACQRLARRRGRPDPRLAMTAFGLSFPGPLGLAAGFDKGASCYNALLAMGFGHVEVGTITPRAQEGGPRPRVERLPVHHALVNRLGFNNPGASEAARRLTGLAPRGIVGANVGRNRDTPEGAAFKDFIAAASALAPHVAHVTLNVSSPNTPGLRRLQEPAAVAALVGRVLSALDDAGTPRPVLVKLHPDVDDDALVGAARAAVDAGAAGLVAINTTTTRPPGLAGAGSGGLSGRPLRARATRTAATLAAALRNDIPIIGVGGIETGVDALERVRAGATVLQAYTGFIYRGPRFPVLVHREMVKGLDALGVDRLEELVGRDSTRQR